MKARFLPVRRGSTKWRYSLLIKHTLGELCALSKHRLEVHSRFRGSTSPHFARLLSKQLLKSHTLWLQQQPGESHLGTRTMAAAVDADLMSVGRHCAHDGCHQLDFLPFRCSRCSKIYCLEHRVCPCNQQEATVLVCPLCAQAVVCPAGGDVELVFDRHTRTDCDPANYDRVHRKPRCPVAGCREKLGAVNSYTCKECGAAVCLKHRLPADHKCVGRAAAAASKAQGRLNPQNWRRMFSVGGTSGASTAAITRPAATQQVPPPQRESRPARSFAASGSGSSARPTVAQRAGAAVAKTREGIQSQLQQYRQQRQQRSQPGSGAALGASSASTGQEVCQCGARFATVQQLIEHAEVAHAGGWSSGPIAAQRRQGQQQGRAAPVPSAGGLERCPHCGLDFADPVALVAHVEHQHAAQTNGPCVLC